MKADYENRARYALPRRTSILIRIDGKTFDSFTAGCARPFDHDLMRAMDETTLALCREVQGACGGYVPSDETSLVRTDFETPTSEAWFDGGVPKIASISAFIATAALNQVWLRHHLETLGLPLEEYRWACFDSRTFTIPERTEVIN